MKNITLFSILILFVSCSLNQEVKENQQINSIGTQSPRDPQNDLIKDYSRMALVIKPRKSELNAGNLMVDIEFKNLTDSSIKLLDMFDPISKFFTIDLISKNGKSSRLASVGFFDPPPGFQLRYIEIKKRKSYTVSLDLSTTIKQKVLHLDPEPHILKISYINYHGLNCIKGRFTGDTELKFNK